MSWEQAIQTIFMMGSGIATWFLYDLVKEFKEFKKETGRDISTLKKERELFQAFVRSTEMTMQVRVHELGAAIDSHKTHLERGLGIIDNELVRIRYSIDRANEKAQKFDDFMKTSFKLSNALNEQTKALKAEMDLLKKEL